MAFGSPPSFEEDLYLDHFTPPQFLMLAMEAAKKNSWRIDLASETGFIAFTNNGKWKWNANVSFQIRGDKATIKSESISGIMDLGKNKKMVQKFIEALAEFKYSIKPEQLDQKYEQIKPNLVGPEQDLSNAPPKGTTLKITDFLSILKPRAGNFITPILVDLNIMIWITMVCTGVNWFLPSNESLIRWGANFRPITLEGQWWRLITNFFLHIGVVHLLFNMYALLYIGLLLEPRLGKAKFLAAYLLTGIAASVTSLWWHDLTISAGASGAIFGMYGVFLAMLTTNLIEKSARRALLASIGIFVLYNLLNGVKGGIDNAAHIGGLLSGILIGYVYIPGLKKTDKPYMGYYAIGILSVLVLSTSLFVYRTIPNDIGKYDLQMEKFASAEQLALGIYRMPKDSPKEKFLSEIKTNGLYNWKEDLKLVTRLDSLDLPQTIHQRNKRLIAYCNLRIKAYGLIYKAIDEDTNKYQIEIQNYNKQIEVLIDSLKNN